VFENKVVDYVAELATQTDKKMSRDDLVKIIQDEGDEIPEDHHH
jgi:trigger factor